MAKKRHQIEPDASMNPMDLAVAVSDSRANPRDQFVKSTSWRGATVNSHSVDFFIDLDVKLGYSKKDGGDALQVFLDFQLEGKNKAEAEEEPSLRIAALFVLDYSLDEFDGLTDANFQAFSNINGIFQGWPFWREFVMNTTARMGIPPVTLPVHRVKQMKKHNTSQKASPSTSELA